MQLYAHLNVRMVRVWPMTLVPAQKDLVETLVTKSVSEQVNLGPIYSQYFFLIQWLKNAKKIHVKMEVIAQSMSLTTSALAPQDTLEHSVKVSSYKFK